jgi:subtilisin family serine protease
VGGIERTSTFHGFKSDSGRIAKSDRRLLHLHGTKITPVMVKLDYDAMASYRGGIAGYAPTSPSVTGRSIKSNTSARAGYARYIGRMESRARAGIARIPGAKVTAAYHLAYGGLAVQLPANQIRKLLRVPGVVAVQADALNHVDAVEDPYQSIGASAVWPSLGGPATAGSNVIVADLDTGIWPENPMLVDNGLPAPAGGPFACDFGDGSDTADLGPTFTCNNKLIGAYVFLNTYLAVIGAATGEFCKPDNSECSARDSEGHGTHTATTAAGDFVDHAPIFGIDRGPTSGMAPGAHIIMYRVCLSQGCFTSDSVAAVNQAIADGANVLNFSISGGRNAFTDAIELAFRDFYASGGLANASAGNSGPGAATADHAGPWENTVGASYPARLYETTLHLSASGGDTADFTGTSITLPITSSTPVVKATDVAGHATDSTCSNAFAPGSVSGQVVVCARGNPLGRASSSFNVMQGGAAGMILYNPAHQDLFTDNFFVPTVMLDGGNATTNAALPHDTDAFLTFLNSHTGVTATWATGTRTSTTPDVMTTFSSRGPLGDWIKPDITAPGIEILAGHTTEPAPDEVASGPAGENFQAIAGTSMSAPHATGVAALVFASHPSWTPGQVKSAMMTSALQSVLKPDGHTPFDPFNAGAGSIRANRAVNPTLTFDESAADYAALSSTPNTRVDANIPSIDATTMPGTLTTTRTAKNVSGSVQTFTVSTTATGGSISVSPSSFTMGPSKTKTLSITIHGETLAPGQYFGSIKLDASGSATDVYMPVAFVKQQGIVNLTSTCTPASIAVGASSSCTTTAQNLAPVDANTAMSEHFSAPSKLSQSGFAQSVTGSGSGAFVETGAGGYDWSGTLSASLPPTIDSFQSSQGPAGGYLPLSLFSVPPISGTDDDTVINFNVPDFLWGSEHYTRIGVGSNGYVVVGGGSGPDVQFQPTSFPNPARPNNVIAPYWTDLNPGAATGNNGERIGTLTDGSDIWIVVDWQGVPTFGTSALQSFEIWIGVTGDANPGEDVSYVYGNTGEPPNAPPLNAGAENRDGTSGINAQIEPPDQGWRIITGPPTPGGKVTITYSATGKKAGSYTLTTRMTSDQTPGTTVVNTPVTVTP